MVIPNRVFDAFWQLKERSIVIEVPQHFDQSNAVIFKHQFELLKSFNKIFYRSLFDTFNECLDCERNFGQYGRPFLGRADVLFDRRQRVGDALVAVDAGALAGEQEALVDVLRARVLPGQVHRLVGVAVPALQRVVRLHRIADGGGHTRKRVGIFAVGLLQRCRAVDIDGCANLGGDGRDRNILGVEFAVMVVKCAHLLG